jgi:hypothetical protein
MRILGLAALALAAGLAGAAEPQKPSPATAPYWLKNYAVSSYRETWTLSVRVRSLDKDLPGVRKAFEQGGGSLIQPLENFPASKTAGSQQLSYGMRRKAAKAALKKLKKTASFTEPRVGPAGEPLPLDEVRDKMRRLSAEKESRRRELSAMPATASLVDEVLERLRGLESAAVAPDALILVNVTVQEKR